MPALAWGPGHGSRVPHLKSVPENQAPKNENEQILTLIFDINGDFQGQSFLQGKHIIFLKTQLWVTSPHTLTAFYLVICNTGGMLLIRDPEPERSGVVFFLELEPEPEL